MTPGTSPSTSYPGHSMSWNPTDLGITAAVAVLTCAAAALGAPVAVMIVLGMVLFAAPGYLLGQLLLGSRVAGLERLAVVTGLALCVPVVGGLLLYAAKVPLHRAAWLGLLAGVTLACDLVLFLRHLLRRRNDAAPPSDKQRQKWRLPTWHAVAFGAAVVIAVCAVGLAGAGAANQHYSGFTQLWLARRDKNAHAVSLGVANHEGRMTRYRLVLFRNNRTAATWNLDLPNGRAWQQTTSFADRSTISAKLYRLPDVSRVYRYVSISANRNSS
jgi:uncharacterized membrane protein